MSSASPLLVLLTLVLVAFAGCIGDDDPKEKLDTTGDPAACVSEKVCGDAIVDDTGRDLRTELLATDTLEPPEWQVGDVFEQHLYYGSADDKGDHIQTMVVDTAGDCYQFGTSSKTAASYEAVFDLPILGCIGKENLDTTGFQADWSWMYDFPLEDGKTWDGSIDFLFNWNDNAFYDYSFTLTATYAEKIDTDVGDFPGFEITGVTPEGETFLSYNYVPAVGWFSHFWMYDLATADADDVIFHAMSMGRSSGYTGTYYIDESTTAYVGFFMPGISVVAGEDPRPTFTVAEGATYLKGIVVPITCAGASRTTLVTPANQLQDYDHQSTDPDACVSFFDQMEEGAPDPRTYTVHFVDQAAEVGDYKLLSVGTGLYGYYVWLEAVTEVAYELEAPPEDAAATDA